MRAEMDILIKLTKFIIILHFASAGMAEDVSNRKKSYQLIEDLALKQDKAQKLLEQGEKQIDDSQFPEAINTLNEGIELIGSEYVSPLTIDDTGQKLVLAKIEQKNGRYNIAANLLKSVLTTRLSIMRSNL